MIRTLFAVAAAALAIATASPGGAQPAPSPGSTANALLGFTGQLLDMRRGYVFFTTGDAFKIAQDARIVDYATGQPTTLTPATRIYAKATLDPANGTIVELALSKKKLASDASYGAVKQYAVAKSTPVPAPELNTGPGLTGKAVPVTFFVQVPPNTPFGDNVYISTDASGWAANAMRMDRIDALHYRLTRVYASGTKFAYRYTRGAWTSVERGQDGLETPPRQFFVREVDARRVDDKIYHWSDEKAAAPQAGPDVIPTPFNPNPFGGMGLPSKIPPSHPIPTPRPT